MFLEMSLRDRLSFFADFVWMTLLAVLCLLPQPYRSFRVCLPTLFAAVLKFFLPLTTSAISGAATSNKSAPRRLAVESWDDKLTQKWNCISPNNLCRCTESPSVLSTNTSIEGNLYLVWSNHHVTFFRLEMNVGGFSEHRNKTSDTYRNKGYFFTARVSQVKLNTLKEVFE